MTRPGPDGLLAHYHEEPAWLAPLRERVDVAALMAKRRDAAQAFLAPAWAPLWAAVAAADPWPRLAGWRVEDGVVCVGGEAAPAERASLKGILEAFRPWKKGPWRVGGIGIDAEWRSDVKWARLLPHLKPLAGRRVLDMGCHNGYFLWRMLEAGAASAVGFDPMIGHGITCHLLRQWADEPRLAFEPLGLAEAALFHRAFDVVFCLGVLYHHTDPVGHLRNLRQAMVPGGELVVDVQGIPGDEALCLVPESRYAGAKGMWFLPTARAAAHWLTRAGFRHVRVVHSAPLAVDEQRPTPWAAIPSLADALDPRDPNRTVEGYPAPWRHYLLGEA